MRRQRSRRAALLAQGARRIAAALVDLLLILVWAGVVAVVTFAVSAVFGSGGPPDLIATLGPVGAHLIGFVSLTVPVAVYLYGTESTARAATVGKRVLRLRVAEAGDGGRPTRRALVVRTVVKLLPWEVAHTGVYHVVADSTSPLALLLTLANVLLVVYVGLVVAAPGGRGPHDLAARTVVVPEPPARAAS